jgi:hypothetical protein
MSCLGVHFSLGEQTVIKLKSYKRESARLNFLQEKIEEEYFDAYPDWVCETDKAWDAIHRILTDGDLTWDNGQYPTNHVILGGELLYTKPDYMMSLKNPSQVKEIGVAIKQITEKYFREAYFKIDPEKYGCLVEDFLYTWENFDSLRLFWDRATIENRYVLFTADQ